MPCKGAEAAYRADLRRRRVKGLPVLGQIIGASEAWARIRTLQSEQFTPCQITGWTDPHPYRLTAQSRIRLSTLIRLRALCARYLIADADLPMHQPHRDDSPL